MHGEPPDKELTPPTASAPPALPPLVTVLPQSSTAAWHNSTAELTLPVPSLTAGPRCPSTAEKQKINSAFLMEQHKPSAPGGPSLSSRLPLPGKLQFPHRYNRAESGVGCSPHHGLSLGSTWQLKYCFSSLLTSPGGNDLARQHTELSSSIKVCARYFTTQGRELNVSDWSDLGYYKRSMNLG